MGRKAYFIYALAITLVFPVLAALYESRASPAAIIPAVPLAIPFLPVFCVVTQRLSRRKPGGDQPSRREENTA